MKSATTTGAVVLLSGGLDSTTALAWALARGYRVTALSVDYGQRHQVELDRARAVAQRLGVPRRLVKVDLRAIGGSALTDDAIAVPKDRDESSMAAAVPSTYVPARNTILLALALGLAETTGATALVIGANAIDYSGYPDCRPPFLRAFEQLAALATTAGAERGVRFEVQAPLLELTKAGIVRLALEVKAPLELTWSCYDPQPGERSCGRCDSCRLRLKGFAEAGAQDPIPYAGAPPVTDDQPLCPQARPYVQREAAAGPRAWCACGRSKTQPFCDGAHAGTRFRPVVVQCAPDKTNAWCGCKQTKTPPFCDGSHSRLPRS